MSSNKRHPVTFDETIAEHAKRLFSNERQVKLRRYALSSKMQGKEPHPTIPWEIREMNIEDLECSLRVTRGQGDSGQIIYKKNRCIS